MIRDKKVILDRGSDRKILSDGRFSVAAIPLYPKILGLWLADPEDNNNKQ